MGQYLVAMNLSGCKWYQRLTMIRNRLKQTRNRLKQTLSISRRLLQMASEPDFEQCGVLTIG